MATVTQKKPTTKAEKRVIIAKDALIQLRREKFRAAHCYVSFDNMIPVTDKQLQDVLPQTGQCGATFISSIRKFNDFTVKQLNTEKDCTIVYGTDGSVVSKALCKYFDKLQLILIEYAYEGRQN